MTNVAAASSSASGLRAQTNKTGKRKVAREPHAEIRNVSTVSSSDSGFQAETSNEAFTSKEDSARHMKSHEWMNMFDVRVRKQRDRKPDADSLLEVAAIIASSLLRAQVSMDVTSGLSLPVVSCACHGCTWALNLRDMPKDIDDHN